jgi:hypothetical protein
MFYTGNKIYIGWRVAETLKRYYATIERAMPGKNKGFYAPIFKFEDRHGNIRYFKSIREREITPFNNDITWPILLNERTGTMCEPSDRIGKIAIWLLTIPLLLTFATLFGPLVFDVLGWRINYKILAFMPKIIIVLLIAITIALLIVFLIHKYDLDIKYRTKKTSIKGPIVINATIIDYKKITTYSRSGGWRTRYYAIYEYTYMGYTYLKNGAMQRDNTRANTGKLYLYPSRGIVTDIARSKTAVLTKLSIGFGFVIFLLTILAKIF